MVRYKLIGKSLLGDTAVALFSHYENSRQKYLVKFIIYKGSLEKEIAFELTNGAYNQMKDSIVMFLNILMIMWNM